MLSIAFWLFVWGSVVAAANFYKTIHLSILDIFHLNYLPTCVLNRIQNIFMLQQNKICFQFVFLLSTIWIIVFILNDFSSAIQWINKMTSCFVFYFPSCDKKKPYEDSRYFKEENSVFHIEMKFYICWS